MWNKVKTQISIVCLSLSFWGCGSSESGSVTPSSDPNFLNSADTGQFVPFNPIAYGINMADPLNPSSLIPGVNPLELFQYDALVEPDLSVGRTSVNSFITGIGIDIVDSTGKALPVSITLEARQYDASTGNFSSTTRIFANVQGANVSGGQNFVILNQNSPNYLMTGLGLKMKNAKVSNLVLQRKTFSTIFQAGSRLNAENVVTLPVGWGAVGFILKVGKPADATTYPFIQDALLFIGQLIYN